MLLNKYRGQGIQPLQQALLRLVLFLTKSVLLYNIEEEEIGL